MKVFVDTNILVSAFLVDGVTRRLIAKLLQKHELYVSNEVIQELERTLSSKLLASPLTIETYIAELRENTTVIGPPYKEVISVRDANDIPILSAALKAKVDALVTGDKDLLEIPNPPIKILRPRALYDSLI